jgi:hypothetical protein
MAIEIDGSIRHLVASTGSTDPPIDPGISELYHARVGQTVKTTRQSIIARNQEAELAA